MQRVELSTPSEDSATSMQRVLELCIIETDRELFQIAGNPPVKAYVKSVDFRNTVVHRATEFGVSLAALDWAQPRLVPDVASDQLLFDDWQRDADGMGVQARIVIPARANGCQELQLQLQLPEIHEEAVEKADEPLQTLPPPTNLPTDLERDAKLQELQIQVTQILQITEMLRTRDAEQDEKIKTLQSENGDLMTRDAEQDNNIKRQNMKIEIQNKKIKAQNKQFEKQNKKIKTQKKKIETFQSENGGLQTKIETFQSENGDLRTKIDDLWTKIDDLRMRNEEQDVEIKTQGTTLRKLVARTRPGREVALRGMLEQYRNAKFSDEDDIKAKDPANDFDKWVLAQYKSLSGRIHKHPTQDEATFALTYQRTLSPAEMANLKTLFHLLYGEPLQL